MMNTENGFVVLEWPYGIRVAAKNATGATSRDAIANATFACAVVDTRTSLVPPGFDREYPTPEAARDAFLRLGPTLRVEVSTPEIDRVMTVSTAHVSPETARAMDDDPEANQITLPVYRKGEFGWFVYLNGSSEHDVLNLPDDLRACVRLARANDCSILCLDRDAATLRSLPTHSWEDGGDETDRREERT